MGKLTAPVDILPLVILRIVFGGLMSVSMVRFMLRGWVRAFYVEPEMHFTYLGFGWVRPLPEAGMTGVFLLLTVAALAVAVGLYYRVAIALFFLLFTYVELLDKSFYLNHYYFISLLSFLLLWMPLGRAASLDVRRRPQLRISVAPRWMILAVQLQLSLVYIFAGIAKLNADWLLEALPLHIWLSARTDFPLFGPLFEHRAVALAMSWSGALFDLTIPFWLAWPRTRWAAYLAVVSFHVLTGLLFPIGMFPWIMIGCTLIFFPGATWRSLAVRTLDLRRTAPSRPAPAARDMRATGRLGALVLTLFFLFQLFMPLRHWLYPGDVRWTEEGYRFAWHVMLVEKNGHAVFHLYDPATDRAWEVFPKEHLTLQQEKQMSFQPDMMLQFAHWLADGYQRETGRRVEVRVENAVSLNGRPSRPLVDPAADLAAEKNSMRPKAWILPVDQPTVPAHRTSAAGVSAK